MLLGLSESFGFFGWHVVMTSRNKEEMLAFLQEKYPDHKDMQDACILGMPCNLRRETDGHILFFDIF